MTLPGSTPSHSRSVLVVHRSEDCSSQSFVMNAVRVQLQFSPNQNFQDRSFLSFSCNFLVMFFLQYFPRNFRFSYFRSNITRLKIPPNKLCCTFSHFFPVLSPSLAPQDPRSGSLRRNAATPKWWRLGSWLPCPIWRRSAST